MHFKCAHIILPLYAYLESTPPRIAPANGPKQCFDCYSISSNDAKYPSDRAIIKEASNGLSVQERRIFESLYRFHRLPLPQPDLVFELGPTRHVHNMYEIIRRGVQECRQQIKVNERLMVDEIAAKLEEKRLAEEIADSWQISWELGLEDGLGLVVLETRGVLWYQQYCLYD